MSKYKRESWFNNNIKKKIKKQYNFINKFCRYIFYLLIISVWFMLIFYKLYIFSYYYIYVLLFIRLHIDCSLFELLLINQKFLGNLLINILLFLSVFFFYYGCFKYCKEIIFFDIFSFLYFLLNSYYFNMFIFILIIFFFFFLINYIFFKNTKNYTNNNILFFIFILYSLQVDQTVIDLFSNVLHFSDKCVYNYIAITEQDLFKKEYYINLDITDNELFKYTLEKYLLENPQPDPYILSFYKEFYNNNIDLWDRNLIDRHILISQLELIRSQIWEIEIDLKGLNNNIDLKYQEIANLNDILNENSKKRGEFEQLYKIKECESVKLYERYNESQEKWNFSFKKMNDLRQEVDYLKYNYNAGNFNNKSSWYFELCFKNAQLQELTLFVNKQEHLVWSNKIVQVEKYLLDYAREINKLEKIYDSIEEQIDSIKAEIGELVFDLPNCLNNLEILNIKDKNICDKISIWESKNCKYVIDNQLFSLNYSFELFFEELKNFLKNKNYWNTSYYQWICDFDKFNFYYFNIDSINMDCINKDCINIDYLFNKDCINIDYLYNMESIKIDSIKIDYLHNMDFINLNNIYNMDFKNKE